MPPTADSPPEGSPPGDPPDPKKKPPTPPTDAPSPDPSAPSADVAVVAPSPTSAPHANAPPTRAPADAPPADAPPADAPPADAPPAGAPPVGAELPAEATRAAAAHVAGVAGAAQGPPPGAPPLVGELAAACVEYVQRAVGVRLDFTPDTLSLLDHYVKQAGAEAKKKPEALELVARAVGAYLGEVIRAQYDCWWFDEGDDLAGWQLRFGRVRLALSPYALAVEALGVPLPEGLPDAGFVLEPDDMEEIGEHLAKLPPVPEDEFVLPTTRFDTLQIVVDQLKGRAIVRGQGDEIYEDADYEEL